MLVSIKKVSNGFIVDKPDGMTVHVDAADAVKAVLVTFGLAGEYNTINIEVSGYDENNHRKTWSL